MLNKRNLKSLAEDFRGWGRRATGRVFKETKKRGVNDGTTWVIGGRG